MCELQEWLVSDGNESISVCLKVEIQFGILKILLHSSPINAITSSRIQHREAIFGLDRKFAKSTFRIEAKDRGREYHRLGKLHPRF